MSLWSPLSTWARHREPGRGLNAIGRPHDTCRTGKSVTHGGSCPLVAPSMTLVADRKAVIALFLPSLEGGGAERVTVTLAQAFSLRGFEVDIVLGRAVGPYLDDVPASVKIVDLSASRVLWSLPKLANYLSDRRPSVLISALIHSNIIATCAARYAVPDMRVILGIHHTLSEAYQRNPHSGLLRLLVPVIYRWADAMVAVSNGVAEDLSVLMGVEAERIHVIYNPIDAAALLLASKEPTGHPQLFDGAAPVIIGVGSLLPGKDFSTLARAFALVREKINARLVIVGEGVERGHLEDLSVELGIERDVYFPGFVANPYSYLVRSSVFVLSSISEGLPTAMLEAAFLGLPIVATDCKSGPREILEGGRYGRLIPIRDPVRMADAILEVLRDPPRFVVPPTALQAFSPDKVVDEYLKVCGLGGRPRAL